MTHSEGLTIQLELDPVDMASDDELANASPELLEMPEDESSESLLTSLSPSPV